MIKRLQTQYFFAVYCSPNQNGFLAKIVFVSSKNKSQTLNILNPDTKERFIIISPLSGFHTDYQLILHDTLTI